MSLRKLPLLAALLVTFLSPSLASSQMTRKAGAEFVASSRGQVFYWVGCDGCVFRSNPAADSGGSRPLNPVHPGR